MNKIIPIITIIVFLSLISTYGDVSVEENNIIISSPEFVDCIGTICTYEFQIENTAGENVHINVFNAFNNLDVKVLSAYRWGKIYTPQYEMQDCDVYYDDNGTLTYEQCPVYIGDSVSFGFVDLPVSKYEDFKNSYNAQTILINKNTPERIRFSVYQPLGQFNKFDISTYNTDYDTETILDPWLNTTFYYINLTDYWNIKGDANFNVSLHNYYQMDTIVASLIDSVGGNHGTVTGASSGTGQNNDAVLFDGNNDKTTFSDFDIINDGNWTILLWLRTNASNWANGDVLFDFRSEAYFIIETQSNGTFTCLSNDGTWKRIYSTPINDDSWTLLGCRYNDVDDNMSLIINDSVYTSQTIGTIGSSANGLITLGTDYGNSKWSDALIDEIMIWNRTLSDTEISELYNNGLGYYYPDWNKSARNNGTYIITNADNMNENLSISTNLTGVLLSFNNDVLELNDSALGNSLNNTICYNLTNDTLNWSLNINYTGQSTQYAVNYTFTNCSIGGGNQTNTTTTTLNLTQIESDLNEIKEGINMFGLLFVYIILLIAGFVIRQPMLIFIGSLFGAFIFMTSDYAGIIKTLGVAFNVAILFYSITLISGK